MGIRVLINGIDGLLGTHVSELLSAEPEVEQIIGLGRNRPPAPVGRAELLTTRLSGRQLAKLLQSERINTVVHLDFAGAERPTLSREEAVQHNVLGSMELLGACATAGVRRVVLRSHAYVYGASPLNPTFISEEHPIARSGLAGLTRDLAEVERFCAEFAARHSKIAVVPIRCAPLVGAWSPLIGYLRQPDPRMLVGFDPCLQVLHHDDAAAGFVLAACTEVDGPINLATEDTLCLSQAIKLAGSRPAMMLDQVLTMAINMGNRDVLGRWPFDVSFLRHSCVVDLRRAQCVLGWSPMYSAAECVQSLAAPQLSENGVRADNAEEALQAFLSRRSIAHEC